MSPNNGSSSNEWNDIEHNKSLVVRFLELLGEPDLDGAFDLVGPNLQWFTLSSREHTPGAEMKVKIAFVYESLLQGPIKQTISLMTAEGERVAVMSEGYAVTKDGVVYNNLYHFLFVIRDGLIVEIWEFNDTVHVRDVLLRGAGGTLG